MIRASAAPTLRELYARSQETQARSQRLEGQFQELASASNSSALGCNDAYSYASSASMDDGDTDNSSNGVGIRRALAAVVGAKSGLESQNNQLGEGTHINLQQLQQLQQDVALLAGQSSGAVAVALKSASASLEKAFAAQLEAGKAPNESSTALIWAGSHVSEADRLGAEVASDAPGENVSFAARYARDYCGQATQLYWQTRSLSWNGLGQQRQSSQENTAATRALAEALAAADKLPEA